MKAFGCIYVVTHKKTGRFYVGQTRATAEHRWSVHKSDAKLRPRSYFHKAIRAHGPESFEVQTVAIANDQDSLNALEQLWILATGATRRDLGYNLDSGGRSYVRSASTLEKLRLAFTGRKLSAERRAAMSACRKGIPQSEAHKAARSASQKGRIPSLACRMAVTEANRRRVVSPETRAKLSAAAQKANEVRWRKQPTKS